MSNETNCKHENTDSGYGFAAASAGYRGIGVYIFCEDCDEILEFNEDTECCTPKEIEHNKRIRNA